MMPGGPTTKTKTSGERKRTPTTNQNISDSSYLVEEDTPQILSLRLVDAYFKRCFLGSSFVQEGKSHFYGQLELNNNYLYFFGHKENVDLLVCFALKCERTSALTLTRKFCPCVINM